MPRQSRPFECLEMAGYARRSLASRLPLAAPAESVAIQRRDRPLLGRHTYGYTPRFTTNG